MSLRFVPVVGIFVLCLLAAPSFAADKPQDLIVGKWQPKDTPQKATVEFMKDKKLKIYTDESFSFDGTYDFINDTTIQIKVPFGGQDKVSKLKITITKDELTIQEEGSDKKSTFTKAK